MTSSKETLEAVVGNEAWLEEHGVLIDQEKRLVLHSWKTEGKSVVLLAIRIAIGSGSE